MALTWCPQHSSAAAPVSIATSVNPPMRTGQPRRSASMARAARLAAASLKGETPLRWAHGPTACPSRGKGLWTTCAHAPCLSGQASPTYGRAADPGPRFPNPARGSSTRCRAFHSAGRIGAPDRPSSRSLQPDSASISIAVWLTTLTSCLWLHTSVSSGATLKSPVRMVGTETPPRPFGHPRQKIQLLAEFHILLTIRNIAACGHIDIFQPHAARISHRHAALRHWPANHAYLRPESGTLLRIATP
jgi:hypothetical protein